MWLPWRNEKAKQLREEEIRSADKRNEFYSNLFEGQKQQNALEEMVRKSIVLLGGKDP